MSRPGFLEGAVVAAVAATTGSVGYAVLGTLFTSQPLLRLVIAALGLGYLIYLLSRTSERIGRVTTIVSWGAASMMLWLLAPPLTLYIGAHIGLIWLFRSLYFYASGLAALADSGLALFGFAAAVWSVEQTGSLFFGLWSFFLVQALFCTIPGQLPRRPRVAEQAASDGDRFRRAHGAAQGAVTKLSSFH